MIERLVVFGKLATTPSLFFIMEQYPTKSDASHYFERIQWGNAPVCTKCGGDAKITPQERHPVRYCRSHFTALTGMPLEYGKVDPRGISAMQLSMEIDAHYSTAWHMLHRLRLAGGNDMEALGGRWELDATDFGGKRVNLSHTRRKSLVEAGADRGTVGKQPDIAMRECDGRTNAVAADTEIRKTVKRLAKKNIAKGTAVCADGAKAYNTVSQPGFDSRKTNHSTRKFVKDMASTNRIENIWTVLKRSYTGIYHHWSRKHCQVDVNEFTFRLNERNCKRDMQGWLDDLYRAMAGKAITHDALTV